MARFVIMLFLACLPMTGWASEPFAGYPAKVREDALLLIDAAEPGKEELLERKVQALRKSMLEHAIVSINEVPDRLFDRARRAGWEDRAEKVLRTTTRVAPFSVALWAWLVRHDLATLRITRFFMDLEGLSEALRLYGPSLLGCASWSLLFLVASASWFAVWVSISLLLKAQPALTSDLARLLKKLPRQALFAFALFLAVSLSPLLAGVGLGVASVFWLFLSAGYLRRREAAAAAVAVLFLGSAVPFGGALQAFAKYTGETRQGGWLGGEGYFPRDWPESVPAAGLPIDESRWYEMRRFARARAEMQAGNYPAADALWTEWIRDAAEPSEGYNNRGIVRYRLGKPAEALADFEAAMARSPRGGPAYWNSYQLYLQTFRLEEAAKVQETAWGSLRDLALFDYRAEEMTHGELVPSPLRMRGGWKELFALRWDWVRDGLDGAVQRFLFRPLAGGWTPPFLAAALLWMLLWKALGGKIWTHNSCRSCGTCTLVVGGPDFTDICNQCRAQVGGGIRSGEEREHRLLTITMHRRYVKACSVFVPGAGAIWAGKTLPVLLYGLLLSMVLGVVTVSASATADVPALISDMLGGLMMVAVPALVLLWIAGIAWSWHSFSKLQAMYNIIPRR
ncbi:MAG: tetratricopeptide repeat protein [Thermodesulfobacteriota bacterium]